MISKMVLNRGIGSLTVYQMNKGVLYMVTLAGNRLTVWTNDLNGMAV